MKSNHSLQALIGRASNASWIRAKGAWGLKRPSEATSKTILRASESSPKLFLTLWLLVLPLWATHQALVNLYPVQVLQQLAYVFFKLGFFIFQEASFCENSFQITNWSSLDALECWQLPLCVQGHSTRTRELQQKHSAVMALPKSRLAYCAIFVIHIAAVWVARDVVTPYLVNFPYPFIRDEIFNCDTEKKSDLCYKSTVVSRLTFGYAIFHLLLALLFLVR